LPFEMYSQPISSSRRQPAAYGGYASSGLGEKVNQKPTTSIKDAVTKIADTATAMRYRVVKKDYFKSSKRGEIYEWKQQLNDENELVRKETIKKIIAGMTSGKDVNELFTHVLKCIYTKDLEMKKLVYQYLVNYSSSNPELAVLAINSFCKDCEDKNPIIRTLALRTMASIRVDCISEYLLDPLRNAFKDDNPFVRRTAVTAVAKFFETLPELAKEFDLDKDLNKMLTIEINSGVAAAIISSLVDISKSSGISFSISDNLLPKILRHLPECNEWGQITIIESLTNNYFPKGSGNSSEQSSKILDSIIPFLQHSNTALLLSAAKALLAYLPIDNDERNYYLSKLSPPIVSLLASNTENSETLYVVLDILFKLSKIIQLPLLLPQNTFRMLFLKYNDPLAIKSGKLKLLPLLITDDNYDTIIVELAENAKQEVDPVVTTNTIIALVECSKSLGGSVAPLVMGALCGLVRNGQPSVTQSLWLASKDLLILFGRDEGASRLILSLLEESNYEEMSFWEEDALLAYIWIIGEFYPILGLKPDCLDSVPLDTLSVILST
jgi:vesicle coat complex subunit